MVCRPRELATCPHNGWFDVLSDRDRPERAMQSTRPHHACGDGQRLAEEARRRVPSSISGGTSARPYKHVTASRISITV